MRYAELVKIANKSIDTDVTFDDGGKPGFRYKKKLEDLAPKYNTADAEGKAQIEKDLYDDHTDFEKERAVDLNLKNDWLSGGAWRDALQTRGWGYLGAMGGFGVLGSMLAGKKRRLLGFLLGSAIGGGLNYARRKTYYGDAIKW